MTAGARRVLLLHPGSLYGGAWASPCTLKPALVSLFSFLRDHGVEVDVVDLQTELGNPEPDTIPRYLGRGREMLDRRDFDLLAVSCWSSLEYLASVELAAHVRATRPQLPIVVGGYHPTAVPEDFSDAAAPFDVVVRGEGEHVLLALATEKLPEGDGERAAVIDGVPLEMDGWLPDVAGYPYLTERPGVVHLYLSRGCPHTCVFCMEACKGRDWRPYPVEQALQAVARALELRPSGLAFGDACFGHLAGWRRDFLRGLVEMGVDVPLWVEMRADRLRDEDLDLLKRLDSYLQLGVETMLPAMATIMGKAEDGAAYVRAVDRVLHLTTARDLLTKVVLVLNHPGETAATLDESIGYFETLVARDHRLSLTLGAQLCTFFPGSPLAAELDWFARTYGAEVRHPEWWKEAAPSHALAVDVRPSSELEGSRDWFPRYEALLPILLAKMSDGSELALERHRHML